MAVTDRANIEKGHHNIIFVNLRGGNLACRYLAENTTVCARRTSFGKRFLLFPVGCLGSYAFPGIGLRMLLNLGGAFLFAGSGCF